MGKLNIRRATEATLHQALGARADYSAAQRVSRAPIAPGSPFALPIGAKIALGSHISHLAGMSAAVKAHPTVVTRPHQTARLAHEFKIDRAVGQSADIKAHPTTIIRPNQLTHNQAQMAASEHVRRIEAIKGQREASAARTAEVKRELDRAKGGGGGFNEDQPRDEQGRWTSS